MQKSIILLLAHSRLRRGKDILLNKSDRARGQSVLLNLPADGDGKIENGEHVRPLSLDVEVSDDGGSDGGVTGLSDSNQTSSQQQDPEMLQDKKGGRRIYISTARLKLPNQVTLDFLVVHHFDGQGRKNSVIIYYYPSF